MAPAEAKALRPDDLTVWEKGDFGQREPEVLLYLSDGWRQDGHDAGVSGCARKIDVAKARQKAGAMKAAALVIKL